MRPRQTLRWRISLAFTLLAAAVCIFFAGVFILTFQAVERHVFGQQLMAEAAWYAKKATSVAPLELPPGRTFYRDAQIPERFRSLAPGYHEVEENDVHFHMAVYKNENQQAVLIRDESDFERIENLLYLALITGGFTGVGVSLWLARLTAGKIIAPVTRLAEAVQSHASTPLPGMEAEDEIGALARVFDARAQELQHYLHRERLFTGDVSHELRTPLTVILGAAELIGALEKDKPAVLAAAERIRRSTQDMTERVAAFLLLSRAPETLHLSPLALKPIVERELERCQPLLKGKEVECTTDLDEVVVNARPELAAIAIGNLLRNACQYTDEGHIWVRLNENFLIIEDTGPGLPPSVRNQLFERFVRGTEDAGQGSGLGLAIVKRVAEHLGWQVQCSVLTTGTRFMLWFPSQPPTDDHNILPPDASTHP